MSAANAVPSPGRTVRVLALALCTSPVVMLVAVLVVLPPSEGELSLPVALGVLALVAAAFALAQVVGYRAAPLPPGLGEAEARRRSVAAYQTLMMLRFVVTEVPVILGIALAFSLDQGPWPFVLAVVAGVPSMLFHVLVRRSSVDRVRAGLESGGARSSLDEALAA
ncbi:hypothetical protein [Aeromicrobium sp.]|uniref:hypothetical protein n=1 Tax=Aeromicrobium sp. TaxID=1871063 RepID=UPI003511A4B6